MHPLSLLNDATLFYVGLEPIGDEEEPKRVH